jgi:flagellar biosynthesis chaperone FliJ
MSNGISLGAGAQTCLIPSGSSISIGQFTEATGKQSIAIGSGGNTKGIYPAKALGDFSIAIGSSTVANNINGLGEIKIGSNTLNLWYYDGGTGWKVGSDIRDKINISNINNSLNFILSVDPIRFRYNYRKVYSKVNSLLDYNKEEHAKATKAEKTFNYGVKAQQVANSLKDIYGSEFYGNIISKHEESTSMGYEDAYSINMTNFIPFLIGAIKEQQETIKELEARIQQLEVKYE